MPIGVAQEAKAADHAPATEHERARQLVLRHGWNTTCFQIVNPGIEYWFGEDGESVVDT